MNEKYPQALEDLMELLRGLPGVGRRSAERMAMNFFVWDENRLQALAETLSSLKKRIGSCSVCGNLTDSDPCKICSDPGRRKDLICVVETPRDLMAMERIRDYNGTYHVLHGVISPMDGVGPEDINLKSLIKRLQNTDCEEVIIATNPTIQGEATAMYISRLLKPAGIKVSRIAHGVPVGSDLEYADEVTLLKSFEGRREI